MCQICKDHGNQPLEFSEGEEDKYRKWVDNHQEDGYVVNCNSRKKGGEEWREQHAGYPILHPADCHPHIKPTKSYLKICWTNKDELIRYMERVGNPISSTCEFCS